MNRIDNDVGKFIKVFRRDPGEIIIYYDYRAARIGKENLLSTGVEICDESGGKIILDAELANYGILSLRENLAIENSSIVTYSIDSALESVARTIVDAIPDCVRKGDLTLRD